MHNMDKEEKRDLRRLAKMYEAEAKRIERMARRQEKLIRKGRIVD